MRRGEGELLRLPSLFPPPQAILHKQASWVCLGLSHLTCCSCFIWRPFIALFVALLLGYLGHVDRAISGV